eukprot:9198209-Pyramimonas_sp.AAC.1
MTGSAVAVSAAEKAPSLNVSRIMLSALQDAPNFSSASNKAPTLDQTPRSSPAREKLLFRRGQHATSRYTSEQRALHQTCPVFSGTQTEFLQD